MARLLLAVLALLLAAAAPVTLVPDADGRWIEFAPDPAGHIRFRARVDGREVVALLDTGVSHSVLARRSPAVASARLVPAGEAVAIGGGVPVERMPVERIDLGGLARDGGTLLVADLGGAATGETVDLLVGQDLLSGIAIDIDYPARRFRFLPSGRLPFAGETAPLAAMPGQGLPLTALTIGRRRLAPVLVDTGDGAAATLGAGARDALPKTERVTSGVSWGLGSAVEAEVAVVAALSLGEATAREVEVRFEAADGFAARLGLAGRIGAALLSRYRVLIDLAAGRMVLREGAAKAEAPVRSTSGLLVRVADDRLRVLHVMRGGPAAAAGWRAGEEICAVDGRRVAAGYAASPLARWTVGAPGTTVALTPCGGAPRRLTLSRFY